MNMKKGPTPDSSFITHHSSFLPEETMRHHRFDPRDLFTLQDRMNRLFEEAADRRAGARAEAEGEIEHADWIPAADVYEDEREYLLALDLPGINRDGLDVSLDDGRLRISGERAALEHLR